MAIIRNPKSRFSRIENILLEEIPLNMVGIIVYFLSKPPDWRMRFNDLAEHWTASRNSLRKYLRLLRGLSYIEIKPYYDPNKKRFAGTYYQLVEFTEGKKETESFRLNKVKSGKQSYKKQRGSAFSETLQNLESNNKNEIFKNNTNNMFIERNNNYKKGKIDTYIPEYDD